MPILQVTAEQIHSIKSAEQLTDLLRKLMHAEARAQGIARRGVSAPAQITVSDDGEDAKVEWTGGPPSTDYFPARITSFQCKATKMPRSECAKEVRASDGTLKLAVLDALQAAGAYVMFSTDKCVGRMRSERISGIRDGIAAATGGAFPGSLVDFYDANKISEWINEHPPVASWALSELFGRPVSGFQSWESWSQNPDIQADQYEFVPGTSADGTLNLQSVVGELRAHLSEPRSVARIVGLSGLGKTRVALEVFRPPKGAADAVLRSETDSVIYANAQNARIMDLIQVLRDEHTDGIVVVDDCDIGLHRTFANITQHPDSNLSLLTVDYDPTTVHNVQYYVELKRLSDEAIKGILRQAYPSLPDVEVDRITAFAQGFPKMAVLLGDAALTETGGVVRLGDDVLLKRMVWGRTAESEVGQRALAACSLFDTLGVDGSSKMEMEFVATEICGLPWQSSV